MAHNPLSKSRLGSKGGIGLFAWFLGEQVGSTHAVLLGGVFFRGATKAVEVGRYVDVPKCQAAQVRD